MALGLPPVGDSVAWTGSLVIALVTLAIGMQKALRIWSAGATDLNRSQGENQVIKLLREELERLAEKNEALDIKLEKLQEEVASLRLEVVEKDKKIAQLQTRG